MESKLETVSRQLINERAEEEQQRFAEIFLRLVGAQSSSNKSSSSVISGSTLDLDKRSEKDVLSSTTSTTGPISSTTTQPPPSNPIVLATSQHVMPNRRPCRPPLSKKFAHPCSCNQSNGYYKLSTLSANSSGNSVAHQSPLHLYDPSHKKCLPVSKSHDMLLRECRTQPIDPIVPIRGMPDTCYNKDLFCDSRRLRCVCKSPMHVYYESNSTFGCVPIGSATSPDGRVTCRSGHVYSLVTKECQKIFDVSELPPNYTTGVSATQFSFVTIVLIWILLLVLIVTAKLRKLRTSSLYRNSPTSERRIHGAHRNSNQNSSAWLHPFIAAVHGHHHLNPHRTTLDRHSQVIDESGNYNDTDLFLSHNGRRVADMLSDNNFNGSQQSLNNPPPKFEEIYPSCPEPATNICPPSNEDLPSYDEAMKLQNTMPPDPKE